MKSGIYKGYKYSIYGCAGYQIENLHTFKPMYGNIIFNVSEKEADKILLRKVKYQINKKLKEKNKKK